MQGKPIEKENGSKIKSQKTRKTCLIKNNPSKLQLPSISGILFFSVLPTLIVMLIG
jgi:hypothetical protein